MNANVKLIPSALGLLLGLWMLACGNETKTVKIEKSGRPVSSAFHK
ncbi:hypothetical protein ACO2Q8_15630 [Larkinella sp. VNQ87]